MLTALKTRTIDLARGPNAERGLWAVSFAESSFFPLPPDLMLIPMAAAEPTKWFRYALGCTIASVLGGLLGYAIGMFLMDTIGTAILNFFGYAGERRAELEAFYDQYGAWFIFLKGLTPIPYKLVTIISGALHFSLPIFIVASIITRGLRFFAVAWIAQRFGPALIPVIERRMGIVLLGVIAVIVVAVLAIRFMH